MLRLTLAQMRRSLGRLTAAGIAIVLGTAFVAATLLAGNAITRTTYDAVTSSYAEADLVIDGVELDDAMLAAAREVPGVDVIDPQWRTYVEVVGRDGRLYTVVKAKATHPGLEAETLSEGALPSGAEEVALPASLAELVGVEVGDTVTMQLEIWTPDPDDAEGGSVSTTSEDLEVTGLLDDGVSAFIGTGGAAVADEGLVRSWMEALDTEEMGVTAAQALVALAPGADLRSTQEALRASVDGATVQTVDEAAEQITAELTGSSMVFTAIVLGFAAVALLVAGLVITNTFQVLVAQRTRTLALLRCVGAGRKQLRRSVLIEASLLGVAASTIGLVLGAAVVQGALSVLGRTAADVPLPETVTITPVVVLVPLLVGTAVTLVAALSPARAATRVSALAALRPAENPQVSTRSGRLRAWFSGLLVVGGFGLLALGMVLATNVDLLLGLAAGVLGGAASFVGFMVAAVFWVPWLIRGLARLLSRGGPAATLAGANSIRNPRRTASTSSALLVGVTLVAMMSTGAASTRHSLNEALDEQYPVDVQVETVGNGMSYPALPAAVTSEVREVEEVRAIAETTRTMVAVVDDLDGATTTLETFEATAIDPSLAREVLRTPDYVAELDDASVVVAASLAMNLGIEEGQELTLTPAADEEGASSGAEVTLTVATTEMPSWGVMVTDQTMALLDPAAPVSGLWLGVTDLDDASAVVSAVDVAAAASDVGLSTTGAAIERGFYQQVIDTLLAVVVGLLAVAVVIALVGVANTLSLSVIERRRESATLRALGLSRRQLRATLAMEGLLVAAVGALVGSLLGVVYGWAGSQTLLGEISAVGLTVPWRDLGLVLLVALAAGLLASVLPGRNAARTPPVQALGVE
ncbi:FtsX-like permease family protein [Actinotalea sp. BY-33]|uniref:FtsX-like permease family protein n=1 Tax=Actinotalea soli TaxID=2819234 RepID=A0A939LTC7_9CELL|nr:FtsX-like permease family protein [Actinotalea soli]MBO1750977.1 FtsX-like permease family protein [Actinotalea soli]